MDKETIQKIKDMRVILPDTEWEHGYNTAIDEVVTFMLNPEEEVANE